MFPRGPLLRVSGSARVLGSRRASPASPDGKGVSRASQPALASGSAAHRLELERGLAIGLLGAGADGLLVLFLDGARLQLGRASARPRARARSSLPVTDFLNSRIPLPTERPISGSRREPKTRSSTTTRRMISHGPDVRHVASVAPGSGAPRSGARTPVESVTSAAKFRAFSRRKDSRAWLCWN